MPANPRERNFWKVLAKHRTRAGRNLRLRFRIVSAAVIGENPRLFGFQFDSPLKSLEQRQGGSVRVAPACRCSTEERPESGRPDRGWPESWGTFGSAPWLSRRSGCWIDPRLTWPHFSRSVAASVQRPLTALPGAPSSRPINPRLGDDALMVDTPAVDFAALVHGLRLAVFVFVVDRTRIVYENPAAVSLRARLQKDTRSIWS